MSKMLTALVVLFSLSSAAGVKYSHITGTFGDQKITLDFSFGDDVMVVTTHKPFDAQDTFRETDNLHIFSKRIVAIRDSVDKVCYIQPFNATEDQMKERVQKAIVHNGDFGDIKEERVSLQGLRPLLQRSVKRILGAEIAKFCDLHQVYILSHNNYYLLQPQVSPMRERRFAVRPRFDNGRTGVIFNNDWGYPKRPWNIKDILIVC